MKNFVIHLEHKTRMALQIRRNIILLILVRGANYRLGGFTGMGEQVRKGKRGSEDPKGREAGGKEKGMGGEGDMGKRKGLEGEGREGEEERKGMGCMGGEWGMSCLRKREEGREGEGGVNV